MSPFRWGGDLGIRRYSKGIIMKSSTWAVRIAAWATAVGVIFATNLALGAGWARSYRAPACAPAWGQGSIAPSTRGAGYLLTAYGPAPTGRPAFASQALGPPDASGA